MNLKIAKVKSLVDGVGLGTQLRAQYQNRLDGQLYNHTSEAWEDEDTFTGATEGQSFSAAFEIAGEGNIFEQAIPAAVLECKRPVLVGLYDPADLTVGLLYGYLNKKTGDLYNPGLVPIGQDHRLAVTPFPV